MMKYKFKCYNKKPRKISGNFTWSPDSYTIPTEIEVYERTDEFFVTVKANDYEEALEKAKELVKRDYYDFVGIEEI